MTVIRPLGILHKSYYIENALNMVEASAFQSPKDKTAKAMFRF